MSTPTRKRFSALLLLGPGILVAATGVGAGDLATAAFTGNALGVAILWAVLVGAFIKFVLNEGLARFQLVTGEALLDGVLRRCGPPIRFAFLAYFVLWSFFVGSALMSACGVAAHALLPVFEDPADDKILYGLVHSALGVLLVRAGGFKLFERVMSVCIGFMFVTVVVTAVLLSPDWGEVARGCVWPTIPRLDDGGLGWTVALMGGIGGTLTVLCYGYWIREEGREGVAHVTGCRLDLGVGYLVTAVFGVAMVIIGSTVTVEGKGAGLVVTLGQRLAETLGPVGRIAFLIGAWGAVASSLLGVWQAVPYLYCDVIRARKRGTSSPSYRLYLWLLATVPALGLFFGFQAIQKIYAIVGALFMPMLAMTLLALGTRKTLGEHRNRLATNITLVVVLAFFGFVFVRAMSR